MSIEFFLAQLRLPDRLRSISFRRNGPSSRQFTSIEVDGFLVVLFSRLRVTNLQPSVSELDKGYFQTA